MADLIFWTIIVAICSWSILTLISGGNPKPKKALSMWPDENNNGAIRFKWFGEKRKAGRNV